MSNKKNALSGAFFLFVGRVMTHRSSNFAVEFRTPLKNQLKKLLIMEALIIKLEKSNIFEKIDRAIPYGAILVAGYFVGCWLYAII